MFKITSDEKIGNYIDELICCKYGKRNNFCRAYLSYIGEKITPENVHKTSNRFSQIINGSKKIQTHDLLALSHLLGVSCEGILSAGESIYRLNNHITNYEIAISPKKRIWENHLKNNSEAFFLNDEYRKNILNYAFENKNYELIRFLVENNFILLRKEKYFCYEPDSFNDLRIETEFKATRFPLMFDKFCYGQTCTYRNKMIAIAIEKNDIDMIKELRSRETPSMINIDFLAPPDFNEFISNDVCKKIACTKNYEIIDYFSEEYMLKATNKCKNHDKIHAKFIFPGITKVAEYMSSNSKCKHANLILEKILKYNISVENKIMNYLEEKLFDDDYHNTSDLCMRVDSLLFDIIFNKDRNSVSIIFHDSENELNFICMNLFKIKARSKNDKTNSLIKQINDIYDRIANIKSEITINGVTYYGERTV